MRLDELFKNLGYIAGSIGAQVRDAGSGGVPLDELDLTQEAPREVALAGPARVAVTAGEVFRVEIDGSAAEEVRFALKGERLVITGGNDDTAVRVSLPSARRLAVAGSGRLACDSLAGDVELSVAGSGRLEVAHVAGHTVAVSIAGSGRLMMNGHAETLELSIAGSGACDAEGMIADRASVSIAGSGDAIFACNGEVAAHLMGSGNVIVRGDARCSVKSMGSGTVVCERATADA